MLGKAREYMPPGGHQCTDLPLDPGYMNAPVRVRGGVFGGQGRPCKHPPPSAVNAKVVLRGLLQGKLRESFPLKANHPKTSPPPWSRLQGHASHF